MILPIHHQVRTTMAEAVSRLYAIEPNDPVLADIPVELPPNRALGDFAVPLAFSLARRLRKAPRVIAQEVAAALGTVDGFTRIEAAPNGYINFFLDRRASLTAWMSRRGTAAGSTGSGDRRAHRDQSQQGGSHRPPSERRARRRLRAAARLSRTPGRDPELHRRHRRAGGRRRRRLP
jgi:heme-degrading monooxygenase HmoA